MGLAALISCKSGASLFFKPNEGFHCYPTIIMIYKDKAYVSSRFRKVDEQNPDRLGDGPEGCRSL